MYKTVDELAKRLEKNGLCKKVRVLRPTGDSLYDQGRKRIPRAPQPNPSESGPNQVPRVPQPR